MFENENNYDVHPDLVMNQPVPPAPAPEKPLHTMPVEEEEIQQEEYVEETQPAAQPRREDSPNFKNLRAEKERMEREWARERERADRLEAEIRRQTQQQPQQPKQEYDYNLSEDDLATGKHIKSVKSEYQKAIETLAQKLDKSEKRNADFMLRTRYPDMDKVMSVDNIQRLVEANPALAQGLDLIPDYASKAEATYQAIKNAGIFVEDNYQKERARVENNSLKPKSAGSLNPQKGQNPLTRANAFVNTDESESANLKRYEEMMKYAGERN